jgi:hypothetical protein
MSIDPTRCPIPPGFELIGNFSDDFEHFKDTTGYDYGWVGYSKRWKNSEIRSANIVAGFQFKIGPNAGKRWRHTSETYETEDHPSGDITLHFPRKDAIGRGGYLVGIKWEADLTTKASLNKEAPHGTYASAYGLENGFLSHKFRDQSNPINLPPVRDGQWHSFLAVIYNDWYNYNSWVPVFGPTIGLWYSPVATYSFDSFKFLGMGIDMGNMQPRGPLILGIEDSNTVWGDDPFLPEHALQIRIDDVPTEQVEIRNVYAANVRYIGEIPPQNPPALCRSEAKAISDAQTRIKELQTEYDVIQSDLGDFTGTELEIRKDRLRHLRDFLIPKAKSQLSTAKFTYGECKKRLSNLGVNPDIGGGLNHNLDNTLGSSSHNTLNLPPS